MAEVQSEQRLLAAELRPLIELFEQSDALELTVERNGRRVSVKRRPGAGAIPQPEQPPAAEVTEVEPLAIKAHMVGQFYWTRDKQAEPVVPVGERVAQGQIVGFIESMDIMNEVESRAEGKVLDIQVASGEFVEYGRPLLLLGRL